MIDNLREALQQSPDNVTLQIGGTGNSFVGVKVFPEPSAPFVSFHGRE